ncbi:hypothetical protein IEE94_07850 [Yimella sp. cx-573]|nr:hypothetical protein [Yimella sp. cx-573]
MLLSAAASDVATAPESLKVLLDVELLVSDELDEESSELVCAEVDEVDVGEVLLVEVADC